MRSRNLYEYFPHRIRPGLIQSFTEELRFTKILKSENHENFNKKMFMKQFKIFLIEILHIKNKQKKTTFFLKTDKSIQKTLN